VASLKRIARVYVITRAFKMAASAQEGSSWQLVQVPLHDRQEPVQSTFDLHMWYAENTVLAFFVTGLAAVYGLLTADWGARSFDQVSYSGPSVMLPCGRWPDNALVPSPRLKRRKSAADSRPFCRGVWCSVTPPACSLARPRVFARPAGRSPPNRKRECHAGS
jgi:hypothetical protein